MIAGALGSPNDRAAAGMAQDGAIALLVLPRRRRWAPASDPAETAVIVAVARRRRLPARPVLATWPAAK